MAEEKAVTEMNEHEILAHIESLRKQREVRHEEALTKKKTAAEAKVPKVKEQKNDLSGMELDVMRALLAEGNDDNGDDNK